jgi:hypothetical protein
MKLGLANMARTHVEAAKENVPAKVGESNRRLEKIT